MKLKEYQEEALALVRRNHKACIPTIVCIRDTSAKNNIVDAAGTVEDMAFMLANAVQKVSKSLPESARKDFGLLISVAAENPFAGEVEDSISQREGVTGADE
jgi:hypothetical protein